MALIFFALGVTPGRAQQVHASSSHRERVRSLPQTVAGGPASMRTRLAAGKTALSLVVSDFDSDGSPDLITGYATSTGGVLLLQRGSPLAAAPTPQESAQAAAGELVAPFVERAEPIELPVRPDLLRTADLDGHGHLDILIAAKGDHTVYLLLGDGHGGFSAPQALPLAGAISALATWRTPDGTVLLVAGICGDSGCGLQLLQPRGITQTFISTPSAVSSIEVAALDLGRALDLVFIAGSHALLLDGDSALTSSPTLTTLPVASASALAVGSFAWDRRGLKQIAVLDASATLHILARAGLDHSFMTRQPGINPRIAPRAAHRKAVPRPTSLSWTEVESLPGIGPGSEHTTPLLLRGRLSAGGMDDLVVMAAAQYITISHPMSVNDGVARVTPVVSADTSSKAIIAAVAARVSADARSGVVALDTSAQPLITLPVVNRTITVNTTQDGIPSTASENACINSTAGCTLRSAIFVSNADFPVTSANGTLDRINLSPGTYTLTATNSSALDFEGSVNVHLNIDASVNIVGAGCTPTSGAPAVCATILNGNSLDKVFSLDSGVVRGSPSNLSSYNGGAYATLDIFFSGFEVENGVNSNSIAQHPNSNFVGGNMDWESAGAGYLTLNNMIVANGLAQYGYGGGLGASNGSGNNYIYNITYAEGMLEIDNTLFANNKTPEGGGGLFAVEGVLYALNADTFSGNSADLANSPADALLGTGGDDSGGGVYLLGTQLAANSTIANTVFTGNTAADLGGGAYLASAVSLSASTFSLNTAGSFGGGLYSYSGDDALQTVTTSAFTGNTLSNSGPTYALAEQAHPSDGAGLCVVGHSADPTGPTLSMHYSRIHGNSNGFNPGLGLSCDNASTLDKQIVDVTDNWWGCNADPASGASGCDSASSSNGGLLNTAPYTTLLLNLSSVTPTFGSTLTATASLGQDSLGTVYSAANSVAYEGLPVTSFTLTNVGNTVQASPTLNAIAAPATSFAADTLTGVSNSFGSGTASITVDGVSVARTYTVQGSHLSVSSSHSGNFKAADLADVYTLTVLNSGNLASSGLVTVLETPPAGFTLTGLTGSGWTCVVASATCIRSDPLTPGGSFPTITVTVSIPAAAAGSYSNSVSVAGGGDVIPGNNTSVDLTLVIGQPTLTEVFSPVAVAPNAVSTLTFVLGNPAANPAALTGIAFTNSLPTNVKIATPSATTTTCGGLLTAISGTASIALSAATLAAGATCTVSVNVIPSAIGAYLNTTGPITAASANPGSAASATLTATILPVKLAFIAAPPAFVAAGANAGTVTVALEDTVGNPGANNANVAVLLAVTGPAGYSATYTASGTSGLATFALASPALTAAGLYTYIATSGALTAASSTETVTPGAFAALSLTGLAATSAQLSNAATVKAFDAFGNPLPTFTGTVTLTSTNATATITPARYTFTNSDVGSKVFFIAFSTAGTFAVTATSGAVTASQAGIVVGDAIWVLTATGLRTEIAGSGSTIASNLGVSSSTSSLGGVAIDAAGSVWSVNSTSNSLTYSTFTGASPIAYTGGGLNAPVALAVDGAGMVWVANSGNSSVSQFSSTGIAISGSGGYSTLAAGPSALAIDSSGSIWIANAKASTVTRLLGAAAPVAGPLSQSVKTMTLGTQP